MSMKTKDKFHPAISRVNETTFNTDANLFINCTKKELIAFLNKHAKPLHDPVAAMGDADDNDVEGMHYVFPGKNGTVRVIWLPHFEPDNIRHLSYFAHEVSHLVGRIFRDVGMRLSSDSDEAFAYLTGYYFEKFLKNLKRQKI